jgi:hypothetical protein
LGTPASRSSLMRSAFETRSVACSPRTHGRKCRVRFGWVLYTASTRSRLSRMAAAPAAAVRPILRRRRAAAPTNRLATPIRKATAINRAGVVPRCSFEPSSSDGGVPRLPIQPAGLVRGPWHHTGGRPVRSRPSRSGWPLGMVPPSRWARVVSRGYGCGGQCRAPKQRHRNADAYKLCPHTSQTRRLTKPVKKGGCAWTGSLVMHWGLLRF